MKVPSKQLLTGILGSVVLLASAAPAAVAGTPSSRTSSQISSTADRIAWQVEHSGAHPAPSDRIPVRVMGGRITAVGAASSVDLPSLSSGKIVLRGSGSGASALTFSLPSGQHVPAAVSHDGTATYHDGAPSTDFAVQAFGGSVRVETVIKDKTAPSVFAYALDVPAGGHLRKSRTGAVEVIDATGAFRGGFAPPWALDARGRKVPTSYVVNGNTVEQVVSHRGASYPVVADPYAGINLIDHADWVLSGLGWTFQVTPTWWARANGGSADVGIAGWDELYNRYHNAGLDTNLSSMANQYVCHQQIAFVKPTWNLDEWRPDVGYAQTVFDLCNP